MSFIIWIMIQKTNINFGHSNNHLLPTLIPRLISMLECHKLELVISFDKMICYYNWVFMVYLYCLVLILLYLSGCLSKTSCHTQVLALLHYKMSKTRTKMGDLVGDLLSGARLHAWASCGGLPLFFTFYYKKFVGLGPLLKNENKIFDEFINRKTTCSIIKVVFLYQTDKFTEK